MACAWPLRSCTLRRLDATGAIRADFTYDAENRLIAWTPLASASGAKKCEFEYDYLGRRIEKRVYTYSSGWSLSQTRRWVWQDWLPLLELDGNNTVIRKYTWGHDLAMGGAASGSTGVSPVNDGGLGGTGVSPVGGAGGIGGLLAISDPNDPNDPNDLHGDWAVFYDASGNVGQLVDWAHDPNDPNNSMDARYEYDAYGNVLTSAGSYAAENPIRFSTKHWDSETGMGYWGYRLYDPRLGRWINRDPIGERGGMNLMSYVQNRPSLGVDPLGLTCYCIPGCPCGGLELSPHQDAGAPPPIVPSLPSFPDCPPGSQLGLWEDPGLEGWTPGGPKKPLRPDIPPYRPPIDPVFPPACAMCLAWHSVEIRHTADLVHAALIAANQDLDLTKCQEDALQHCIGAAIAEQSCPGCGAWAGAYIEIHQDDNDLMDLINNEQGARLCGQSANPGDCCLQLLMCDLLDLIGGCH